MRSTPEPEGPASRAAVLRASGTTKRGANPRASGTTHREGGNKQGAPVIGLSAYSEPARWAVWHAPAVLLPAAYAQEVAAAGGIPVLLPPLPGVAAAVSRLDGLILTGGGDIGPGRYGESPHPRTTRVSEARDAAELELLDAALSAGLPLLGICRGMQLLNVAMGGTLRQHLPDGTGHAPDPGTYGVHPVRVASGSRLAAIFGKDTGLDVPTAHHQAIETLGDGLAATAWAQDGVVEAVEMNGGSTQFVVAVQWHPEVGTDRRLIEALVAEAAERRGKGTAAQKARGRAGLADI